MAFSPDGMHLVVATTIGCHWYDLDTMRFRRLWNTERGMLSDITFSHDGEWIATGNWDGDVKIWDTQTLQCGAHIKPPKKTEAARVSAYNLLFSQDAQYLTFSHLIKRFSEGTIHVV